ncbi:M20/M25/M40 family metallo-hydrolase [Pendulispora albinea]|uniref:M20/M25/M40 family metallo-hydrolase n=1 Tax=Pendulispora albinea TaxID=2741071 RepID=A0ABZ2LXV6_9BACT
MRRHVPLLLLPLLGCASPTVPPPTSPNAQASSSTSSTRAGAPITPLPPATPAEQPLRPLAEETRAVLDQLVAVDTSHGHETDALRPVAERLRAAGLPVELLESAPGRGNLVARYKGNGSKKPLLLIAHVDVVPVEGQPWTVPPFQVTEKEGFLWGRGINDDKAMAAAIVAIALELAHEKPALSRDVIFALTAGEETGGLAGAKWLAQNHQNLIDAEIALNELGTIRLSDDQEKVLLVTTGVAEKTFQTYQVVARGKGGHSSLPPVDSDPVLALSRALVKLSQYRFPARILPVTKEQFANEAALAPKPFSDVLKRVGSTGRLAPEDERVLSKDTFYNALIRTTCVVTQLSGAPQDNVLPTTAEANVNCRLLPDETREQLLETLKKIAGDPAIEITPKADYGYGPYSAPYGIVPSTIKRIAPQIWPEAPVGAAMGTGATDSRHLRAIGIAAYGVSVSPISKKESLSGHGAHGPDERRPTKWLADGARYLHDLTLDLAK